MKVNWTNVLVVVTVCVIYGTVIFGLQSTFQFSPPAMMAFGIFGGAIIGFVTGWTHPITREK